MRPIVLLPLTYAALLTGCAAQPAPEPEAPAPVVVNLSEEADGADSSKAQKTAEARQRDREIAKNAGILGLLKESDGAALSDVFGTGGLGDEAENALGGLTGSTVGEAFGAGGLGLRGTGRGGGGTGSGIGLGGMGTIGHGSGSGSGFGSGGGRLGGAGKTTPPRVRMGAISSDAGLDKVIIQGIVRSRYGAMRLCYEQRLAKDPKLAGKVVVAFVIAADGTVSSAKAAESTGDQPLDDCVVKVFGAMSFPKPNGGGMVKVKYPIVFSAAGGTSTAPKPQP
jgi:TonB family protein